MSGNRRALIVATGTYLDPKFGELRSPAADAQQLAPVLRDPAIGDFDVVVARDEYETPLRRRIARFFSSAGRDDLLLLHISCHGVKDAYGELYLATPDTEMDLLAATALPAKWLDEQLSRSLSQQKLLFLDCCFSGRFPFGARARAGQTVDIQDHLKGKGRAVITASNAMEYAYEGDQRLGEGQPSHFTEALVEGLRTGEADHDQDGWISVDELYVYIRERVQERSPGQTPTKQITLERALYVARSNWRSPAHPATLDPHIVEWLDHSSPDVRLAGVEALARLLASPDRGIAREAERLLKLRVEDDSRRVAARASEVLADKEPGNQTEPGAQRHDEGEARQRPEQTQRQTEREAHEQADLEARDEAESSARVDAFLQLQHEAADRAEKAAEEAEHRLQEERERVARPPAEALREAAGREAREQAEPHAQQPNRASDWATHETRR